MKKYAAYYWFSDDERGVDVCYAKDFTPNTGYNRYSGPNARPSELLTEFNTIDEAVDFFCAYYKIPVEEMEEVEEDIKYRLYCFHYDRGEYDEAAMYE